MCKLKRLEVKYVRDGIKSKYPLREECYISGLKDNLQLHHFQTVTELWEKWKKENNITIKNVDDVLYYREQFYKEHEHALLEDVVTLSSYWHNEKLHAIYGKNPPLYTAPKQRKWVELMRQKNYGTLEE